jgi:nucleoredoxin
MSGLVETPFTELFGPKLLSKEGEVDTSAVLSGCEYLMIYFSAHWCPPCRRFTPELQEFYSALKAKDGAPKFELVFVSSDKSENQFQEYYNEMKSLALPYANRDTKTALSRKFKVSGIPMLVVIDSKGDLITSDARSNVSEDPTAKNFPWLPPTFEDTFPATVTKQGGEEVSSTSFDSKHLLLYFSAHWCPPCRRYTPELVEIYNQLTSAGTAMEVVFVSSDNSKEEFNEYLSEMPWLAIPFEEAEAKNKLSKLFEVSGIPALVVLGPKVRKKDANTHTYECVCIHMAHSFIHSFIHHIFIFPFVLSLSPFSGCLCRFISFLLSSSLLFSSLLFSVPCF